MARCRPPGATTLGVTWVGGSGWTDIAMLEILSVPPGFTVTATPIAGSRRVALTVLALTGAAASQPGRSC